MTTSSSEPRPFVYEERPSITGTFADGFRMVAEYPRQVLGPMVVVLVPVAIVSSLIMAMLYLTAFEHSDPATLLPLDASGPELFTILIFSGVQLFFGIIAVAATTVAVAACAHRAPIRLVEALDPAFTRIGSLLLLAIVLYLGAAAISATVIGIPVALYLVVRLALSAQCMILHGLGVRGALTASWRSTDGYFLKLIALLVLATLSLLVALTFVGMLGLLEPADRTAEVVTIAALSILQSIVLIPMQAAIVSMLTLFYLNLKATAHDVTAA